MSSARSATKRGSFVHGLELRRQGSRLLLEDGDNKNATRRDGDVTAMTSGILQKKKSQTQLNNEVLREDMESSASKKVDFQRGMEYSLPYTQLCRLLTEGAKIAVKDVFDRFFPPIILQDKLNNPNMKKRLEILVQKGLIDDKQWVKLYPKTRQRASSSNYDTLLLMVILKHVCRLPAPYPDGWYVEPRDDDDGVSANLARLGLLRKDAVCRPDMSENEVTHIWDESLEVLVRLNEETQELAEKITAEELEEEVRYIYVKRLYSLQDRETDIMDREEQMKKRKNTNDIVMMSLNMDMSPDPPSIGSMSSRRPSTVSTLSQPQQQQEQQEQQQQQQERKPRRRGSSAAVRYTMINKAQGMPKEERHTLLTFYKSLVTHVKAPEIMEQLMKAEIFNTEDRMRVFLSEKNRERMDALLRILLTKPATAYTEFCKPIKFKHAHLFELMNKTYNTLKRQAAFRKPDGLTHTMEHIQSYCTQYLTKWTPINWAGAPVTTVQNHYTPLQLLTQDGHYIEVDDIMDPSQDRCTVLIEGVSGCGKTSLCRYLLYGWLTGSVESLSEYALLFLIDCRRGEDLKQALYDQMSSEYQFDKEELWHIIEENQNQILIILDGLDDAEGDYINVISEELLPHCGLIVTSRPDAMVNQQFSRKLNLIGLDKFHVGEYIKKYMELTNSGAEDFSGFYHKLNDCDEEYQVFVLNPFLCSCLCAIRANRTNCNVETETQLLEQFLQALMKQISGKRMEFYDLVSESVNQLQTLAFRASMKHSTRIGKDELERKCGRSIFKLGILVSFKSRCSFINKTIQDFLTARHIRSIKSSDFNQIVGTLRQEKSSKDICRFLCGMQAGLQNEAILRNVMKDIGEGNVRVHKAVRFADGEETVSRGLYTARVNELSLSLQCVHESQACPWIAQIVAQSLPERLVLKSGTISQNALLGLADILSLNLKGVKEIEIHISEEMNIRRYGLLTIARALRSNENVSFLRLEWTSNELFSKFLCDTFVEETKIETVKMVDRSRKCHDLSQNALVQAHLLHAFKRMSHVRTIMFHDCKNPSMLISIIRNCNRQLQTLDLTGCRFTIIGAKELAHLLEYTTDLTTLNLSDVRLSGTIFSHLTKGLKVNKTLRELILCASKMDQMGEILLAESLQFNHSLRRLDISRNALTWTGCKLISQSLRMKTNVNELVILGETLRPECLSLFRGIKRPEFKIVENSSRNGTHDIYAD